MNNERTVWHVGIGFCIACLLFAGIVIKMELSTPVPAVNADRAAVRAKALAGIRAAETQALNHPGWVDESRGLLRLPIETAMQITERVGRQDPAAVRANLANRVEKATAPAPAAPAKPSAFE
jgi:hypothetical protein